MGRTLLPKHVAAVIKQQKDPLRALGMFNSAARDDGFKHTLLTYKCMADKLGSHGEFKAMEDVISEMRMNLDNSSLEGIYVGAMRSYGRRGKVQAAVDTFERMDFYGCEPTVLSYNAIMNVLVEFGHYDQAHKVYLRMLDKGIVPDIYTFTIRIKSFCRTRRPHAALRLLRNLPQRGYDANAVSYCTIIRGLYEEDCRCEACNLFEEMLSLILRALEVMSEMLDNGCSPDIWTYNIIINGLCKMGNVSDATVVLNDVIAKGYLPDVFTFNTLIDGYCKRLQLDKALEIVDRMWTHEMVKRGCHPNIITYNILTENLCKANRVKEASDLLVKMTNEGLAPDTISFNTLIHGFCRNSDLDGAYDLFRKLKQDKFFPTIDTYNIMICAFSDKLNVHMAEQIYNEMIDKGCLPDTYTYSVLVNGFCRTGDTDRAYEFLIIMINKGFIPTMGTFGRVINCLSVAHRVHEAVGLIHVMVRSGVVPEVVHTILSVDKREIAAPKILVEELLKKGHITYFAYELLLFWTIEGEHQNFLIQISDARGFVLLRFSVN
ncbi:hypothetical protein OPV22_024213 [Ensete ventricosum]|uniref:Pentacotripeptide-repeat region of PRORP domain-containing protein n=1 Tax=Ensete ventricosum TaxID=4639 RepID=A0AAV8PDI2_ENSVE|nr:hypothetical protein OPV22_024213 [Ensete ventricosum]